MRQQAVKPFRLIISIMFKMGIIVAVHKAVSGQPFKPNRFSVSLYGFPAFLPSPHPLGLTALVFTPFLTLRVALKGCSFPSFPFGAGRG